jgi:hypothetical protein
LELFAFFFLRLFSFFFLQYRDIDYRQARRTRNMADSDEETDSALVGFDVCGYQGFRFEDRSGIECTLQESGLVTTPDQPAVWFGTMVRYFTYTDPKTNTQQSLPFDQVEEWSGVKEIGVPTRMHLSQAQVRQLLPYLQEFAETGRLPRVV